MFVATRKRMRAQRTPAALPRESSRAIKSTLREKQLGFRPFCPRHMFLPGRACGDRPLPPYGRWLQLRILFAYPDPRAIRPDYR